MRDRYRAGIAVALALVPASAVAQSVPTIDTEDASLGTLAIGPASGRFHPIVGMDVRNGDFARGGYDDDAANLDRVPVHVQLGFAWDLGHAADGHANLWLVGNSSNGVHSPVAAERDRPRGWYESNNLIGVVGKVGRATLGAAYTIKTSPNGIAGTTHEASVTASLDGDGVIGVLHPSAAATVRTRGDSGVFTQVAIEPQVDVSQGENPATLSLPVIAGVGWDGFYARGSGDVGYGSVGLAYTRPFAVADTRWRLRAEASALIRDGTLRRLGSLDAETATVVPLATISLSMAY